MRKVAESYGWHNQNLKHSIDRIHRGKTYQNLSTVWLSAIRGPQECDCGCGRIINRGLDSRVVSNWYGLSKPMNQPFYGPMFFEKDEVGIAWQKAFESVIDHPDLSKFKYILTTEEDNLPPSDGLLRLYESIEKFDVVGGLYWTKGVEGQPMCYGDPAVMPKNMVPQVPPVDTVKECNGLGMGFNLFRIAMFKKLPRPWFRTVQEKDRAFSQDLWFYNNAGREGYRFACDGRVKVGHMDISSGMVW